MAMPTEGIFGEWVRGRREEVRLSLGAFANATGIDPANLSKYERGVLPGPQDTKTLDRIAAALKLKAGSPEHQQLIGMAAASAGRIPPDLPSDSEVVARMPFLFRTARGKVTRDELLRLAEMLKSL
ncbi:MAG TPA: helix-turn-helix transcriptional regulator [Thermoanaerobaculia bacterium]|nr:helix-turn-helix transcriptional regulator [Thermoanaerobaculia bacterium]